MLAIGKEDVFERIYMGKFRELACQHGEFLGYERDRAATDLGLQFTRRQQTGTETISPTIVWFQLKGIHTDTLPAEQYEKTRCAKLRLEVSHLRYWLLQPVQTYLVVYIEAVDEFLVLNAKRYVSEQWGPSILLESAKTKEVVIQASSRLDSTAFHQMREAGDIRLWKENWGGDVREAGIGIRHANLIARLATASDRGVDIRLRVTDWQSKTRGEVAVQERTKGADKWVDVYEIWASMLSMGNLHRLMPYVELHGSGGPKDEDSEDEDEAWWQDDDEADPTEVRLPNGTTLTGHGLIDEVIYYEVGVTLNDLGLRLYRTIAAMAACGALLVDPHATEFLSFAPWHARHV